MFSDGSGCPVPITEVERVLLGHGSGGLLSSKLIEEMIAPAFGHAVLDDAAVLDLGACRIAFTTDSFVVSPIFFPGGDIGELAVNGTINDLAVSGARPIALSLAFILEEGFLLRDLERVIDSARRAAEQADVRIVTGDTKVVGRGHCDGLFVNTAGIGLVTHDVSSARVRPADAVLLSGSIGDHGIAIMAAREHLGLEGEIASDTSPLHGLAQAVLAACPSVHAMRDPTRGGLGAVLSEIATRQRLGIEVDERAIPVRPAVQGAAELLGLDPILVANEGKLVVFVPEEDAPRALEAMRADPCGRDAVLIGRVTPAHPGLVTLKTPIGGERILDLPFAEPLPRIC